MTMELSFSGWPSRASALLGVGLLTMWSIDLSGTAAMLARDHAMARDQMMTRTSLSVVREGPANFIAPPPFFRAAGKIPGRAQE